MKTLQITEENARRLYTEAATEFKTALEDTFGKDFFSEDPADWAKSFEDFLSLEGKNEADLYQDSDDDIDKAEKRIKFVIRVLNKGKTGTPKYYPYFYINSAGGFSYVGYGSDCTRTSVGARLKVFSSEHAIFVGKLMFEDYKIYTGYSQ